LPFHTHAVGAQPSATFALSYLIGIIFAQILKKFIIFYNFLLKKSVFDIIPHSQKGNIIFMNSGFSLKRRAAGFTIMELMLAIMIVGMILTIIYSAFSVGSKACKVGNERAQIFHTARLAMQDIILSLENLEFGATNYLSFIGESGSASSKGESVPDDELEFATTTSPALKPDGRWQAGLARVKYVINRKASAKRGKRNSKDLTVLEKWVTRVDDVEFDEAYVVDLSYNIVGLDFEYLTEDDYDDSWDSETKEQLPEVVKITLYVQEDKEVQLLRSGAMIPVRKRDLKNLGKTKSSTPAKSKSRTIKGGQRTTLPKPLPAPAPMPPSLKK